MGMREAVRATFLNTFYGALQKGERGIGALAIDKDGEHVLNRRVEGVFGLKVVPNRVGFLILLEFVFRAVCSSLQAPAVRSVAHALPSLVAKTWRATSVGSPVLKYSSSDLPCSC